MFVAKGPHPSIAGPSPLERVPKRRVRSLGYKMGFSYHHPMKPTPLTYARAKRMRREPTEAERKLWGVLRNRSLAGFKFYRQVPVGPYIVDFINQEFGVVIEVDGATHGDAGEISHDEKRTAFLQAQGLIIHRVNNSDVFQHMGDVCDGILLVMAGRSAN